jgi:hypothetical protein
MLLPPRPAIRRDAAVVPDLTTPSSVGVRAGQGREAGRQPLLAAQELRLRAGRGRHRVPLRGAARGHQRRRDHRVRRQAQEEGSRQGPRRVRRPPGPLVVRTTNTTVATARAHECVIPATGV